MKNNDSYSPDGNGGSQNDCQEKRGVHTFVEVLAVNSKWLFSLAVIGTGLISAVLFIYGFILSISAIFFAVIGFSFEIHAVQEFLAKVYRDHRYISRCDRILPDLNGVVRVSLSQKHRFPGGWKFETSMI